MMMVAVKAVMPETTSVMMKVTSVEVNSVEATSIKSTSSSSNVPCSVGHAVYLSSTTCNKLEANPST